MKLLSKIQQVRRRNLVVATLLRWLGRVGITLVPYAVFMESNDYLDQAGLMNRLRQYYQVTLLTPDDRAFPEMNRNPSFPEKTFRALLSKGCSCFYAERKGEVIGYCWFHPQRVTYDYLNYELKQDEAYAFGFWTARHARWVAPGLANIVHAHLRTLGKTRIYSVSELFNTPVMALRKKLRSTRCRLYLYVRLFGFFKINILLKDHEKSWRRSPIHHC